MVHRRITLTLMIFATATSLATAQNKRDTQVKKDKKDLAGEKAWIYNDLDKAVAAAKTEKKPMMVVFR